MTRLENPEHHLRRDEQSDEADMEIERLRAQLEWVTREAMALRDALGGMASKWAPAKPRAEERCGQEWSEGREHYRCDRPEDHDGEHARSPANAKPVAPEANGTGALPIVVIERAIDIARERFREHVTHEWHRIAFGAAMHALRSALTGKEVGK